MFFNNVKIIGMAHVDAPHRITSNWIEEQLQDTLSRLEMRPNLIESLTGIKARRFWDPGVQPSEAATEAARLALEDAQIPKDKLGLLMTSSVSKDCIEPSIAALVHGNLGLPSECLNFDVGNACLGFLNAMEIAGNMIERRQIDYALISSGESSRDIVENTIKRLNAPETTKADLFARFATLTLGSAGVAMVLTHSDLAPEGHDFKGGITLADTANSRLCIGHNHDMTTDAKGLLTAGVKLSHKTYRVACEKMDWDKKDFDHFVIHQIGEAHVRGLVEVTNIDGDKIYKIYPEYGNTGPTTIPLALSIMHHKGAFKKGEHIGLVGIGSGINLSMMEIVY